MHQDRQTVLRANFDDPKKALPRIREQLNERYESPEMVEFTLKQKLANVSKLTNKHNRKLYELSDILSEFEVSKSSSSGVLPIINTCVL